MRARCRRVAPLVVLVFTQDDHHAFLFADAVIELEKLVVVSVHREHREAEDFFTGRAAIARPEASDSHRETVFALDARRDGGTAPMVGLIDVLDRNDAVLPVAPPSPYERVNAIPDETLKIQRVFLGERIRKAMNRAAGPVLDWPVAVKVLFCMKKPIVVMDKETEDVESTVDGAQARDILPERTGENRRRMEPARNSL